MHPEWTYKVMINLNTSENLVDEGWSAMMSLRTEPCLTEDIATHERDAERPILYS